MSGLAFPYSNESPYKDSRKFLIAASAICIVLMSASVLLTTYSMFFLLLGIIVIVPFLFINQTITTYLYILTCAYALPIVEIGESIHLRLDDLVFTVLIFHWLMNRLLNPESRALSPVAGKWLKLLFAANLLSILVNLPFFSTGQVLKSGYFLVRLAQYVTLYFMISDVVNTPQRRQTVLRLFWFSTLFVCFYGIVEVFIVGSSHIAKGPQSSNHAYIGVYLAVMFFVLGGYSRTCKNFLEKTAVTATLPIIIFVLVLSASRIALLAVPFGLFVMMFFSRYRSLKVLALIFAAAVVVFGLSTINLMEEAGMQATNFDKASDDISGFGRILIWLGVFKFVIENPLRIIAGVGLGQFGSATYGYIPMFKQASGAHNNFLHILVENGIFGLSFFLTFLFSLLKKSYRLARDIQSRDRFLYYGYFCALFVTLFSCLTQETLSVQVALTNFLGFFLLLSATMFPQKRFNKIV